MAVPRGGDWGAGGGRPGCPGGGGTSHLTFHSPGDGSVEEGWGDLTLWVLRDATAPSPAPGPGRARSHGQLDWHRCVLPASRPPPAHTPAPQQPRAWHPAVAWKDPKGPTATSVSRSPGLLRVEASLFTSLGLPSRQSQGAPHKGLDVPLHPDALRCRPQGLSPHNCHARGSELPSTAAPAPRYRVCGHRWGPGRAGRGSWHVQHKAQARLGPGPAQGGWQDTHAGLGHSGGAQGPPCTLKMSQTN